MIPLSAYFLFPPLRGSSRCGLSNGSNQEQGKACEGWGGKETYSEYRDFDFGESLLFVKRILLMPVEVGFSPSIPIQDHLGCHPQVF